MKSDCKSLHVLKQVFKFNHKYISGIYNGMVLRGF